MDWIKLALSLVGKKDEIIGVITDGVALFNRAKTLWPELAHLIDAPKASAPSSKYSVEWLQQSLNKLINANLTVDGNYGSATREAVRLFQLANGLTPDGWAGVQTQAKIADAIG